MGLKKFQIIFDNPWNTFYCGQVVSGKVLMTVDSAKKFRAITIKLKGEAHVSFTDTVQERDHEGKSVTHQRQFTATEPYFENKYNLVSARGSEDLLPVGEHCYPFSCVLPMNIPSSFEGEYGHVRYTVKVTVDRPWKFDNEAKSAFTVINPLDLNLHPSAKHPAKITREKRFGCCCCRSAPLSLTTCLPVTGYVSGQKIPVTIEVDNLSDQLISKVSCQLRKIVNFHVHHPSRRSRMSKATVGGVDLEGSVSPKGSNCWTKELAIPPLPPSNLTNCSIIDLDYEIKVVAHVSSMLHANLEAKVQVVIGTIPLLASIPNGSSAFPAILPQQPALPQPGQPIYPQPGQPMYPQPGELNYPQPGQPYYPQPGQPTYPQPDETKNPYGPPGQPYAPQPGFYLPDQPFPSAPAPGQPGMPMPNLPTYNNLYPDMPPPTYEEASSGPVNIKDDTDSEHVGGDTNYTPRYPFYNFQPSAPPM